MPKKYVKTNNTSLKKRKSINRNNKQKGGKKKLNEFFKTMLKAKKEDLSSFTYKGNTYKQTVSKTGLKLYKKV